MVAKTTEQRAEAKKALAERCRWARTRLEISHKEAARRAGVAESVIGNTEGARNESIRKLTEVARALQVNPHWLATGEGCHDDPVEQGASAAQRFGDLPDTEISMAIGWLSLWREADPMTRGFIESAFAVAGRKDQPALRRA